jgi:hypothetical protein
LTLFNHSVGAIEQRARHVQAKCFGGLEIDYKLEFDWLLDGQIGGLCSVQNLLHIASQTFGLENSTRPVGQQRATVYELAPRSDDGKPMFLAVPSDLVGDKASQP